MLDQAVRDPQGDGDGVPGAEPAGLLAVRGRDPGAAPPHHHLFALPGHGYVLDQCCTRRSGRMF